MDGGRSAGVVNTRRCLAASLLVILASGCAAVTTRQKSAPKLWAGLERGDSKVGFRTAGQVSVWYPAASGGEVLHFGDYAGAHDDLEKSLRAKHFSDQMIADLFGTRMFARRDAVAVENKVPVAMIVLKDGESAADHAVLAEFIASHGYVVGAAPAKANIDAVQGGRPSLFLHNLDVTTWTFVLTPADAKQKAEKILAFVEAHFTR